MGGPSGGLDSRLHQQVDRPWYTSEALSDRFQVFSGFQGSDAAVRQVFLGLRALRIAKADLWPVGSLSYPAKTRNCQQLWPGESIYRKKAYAWKTGAGQATTFGLWCGKMGPRFSVQTQGGLCWTEAGIMRSACLYGSSLGLCWAQVVPMLGQVGPMLGQVGPMLSHLGLMSGQVGPMLSHQAQLGPIVAQVGLCWAYFGLCWTYVGAMFGPSMLERSEDANLSAPGPLLEPKTT